MLDLCCRLEIGTLLKFEAHDNLVVRLDGPSASRSYGRFSGTVVFSSKPEQIGAHDSEWGFDGFTRCSDEFKAAHGL